MKARIVTATRTLDTHLSESIPNGCNRSGGFARVDGEPDQLGARACECFHLLCGSFDVAVSVFVIDCTTMGELPPTRTDSIET